MHTIDTSNDNITITVNNEEYKLVEVIEAFNAHYDEEEFEGEFQPSRDVLALYGVVSRNSTLYYMQMEMQEEGEYINSLDSAFRDDAPISCAIVSGLAIDYSKKSFIGSFKCTGESSDQDGIYYYYEIDGYNVLENGDYAWERVNTLYNDLANKLLANKHIPELHAHLTNELSNPKYPSGEVIFSD